MIQEEFSDLPHDYNAEYQLIGWVLLHNELLTQIFLGVEAFYYPFHADIWGAIKTLSDRGESVSPFTIKPLLKTPESEDVMPATEYLARAVSASFIMLNPIDGAKYLEGLMHKRILAEACMQRHENETLDDRKFRINSAIRAIEERSPNADFEDNLTVSDQIIKDLNDKRLPYRTGLKNLDKAMDGGLYSGKSYGFAARKKVGKTALAATISANLNQDGVKHLFICGEMSPKEIHQRILSRTANIFPSAFRTDYGQSKDCSEKLMQAATTMPRNILYKNAPGVTFEQLRQICTVAVEKHRVKGFILDYWQLVGGKQKNQSDAAHLDEVAQWIADFGRTYDVWTITMAQINQEGNTRGGEGIRLAFDQLYQIHREDLTMPDAWIEMMETRYTPWMNIGSKEKAGLLMMERGPYFEEI